MKKAIVAKTHPAEYRIQKYWARKPHNVLEQYITELFDENSFLVDPFSGSGVFLAESKKRNRKCQGFDINPAAVELTYFTLNPPDLKQFKTEVEKILNNMDEMFGDFYRIDGKQVKYLVHEIITECPNCSAKNSISNCLKKGNKSLCYSCNGSISFNLESSKTTSIAEVILESKTTIDDKSQIAVYLDSFPIKMDEKLFCDRLLIENRRILSFENFKLSRLIPSRNIIVLNRIFEMIEKIKDKALRRAVTFFFTSSVIQLTRLLPYRNSLSTGGPAWSVPGFWVAPKHLESNPLNVYRNRLKKFERAIESLSEAYLNSHSSAEIENIPFQMGMKNIDNQSIDGIFFDPPYGDNVPYLEFSQIWNAFYNKKEDYDNEVIVSDRTKHISRWEKYEKDIAETISIFSKKLKIGGKVIMTFNNNDPRAWIPVLIGFLENNFRLENVSYQIPAVISSKAQLAKNSSYVGDYYCIFNNCDSEVEFSEEGEDVVKESLLDCLHSRNGRAAQNLLYRLAIFRIIANQMNPYLIDRIDEIIGDIAEKEKDGFLKIKDVYHDLEKEVELDITNKIITLTRSFIQEGRSEIEDLYVEIIDNTAEIGSPSIPEINNVLNSRFQITKKSIFPIQPSLFANE